MCVCVCECVCVGDGSVKGGQDPVQHARQDNVIEKFGKAWHGKIW